MIADALGYFWLPCPACGQMFAGFEWTADAPLVEGKGTCGCLLRRHRPWPVKRIVIVVLVMFLNGAVMSLADRFLGATASPQSWTHIVGAALYQVSGMALYYALWSPEWRA